VRKPRDLPPNVYRDKSRFKAVVRRRGVIHRLGAFGTPDEASAAVDSFNESNPKKTLRERFNEKWRLDEESGCWLWTAQLCTTGYGVIGAGGKYGPPLNAHRVSWELHVGPIPTDLWVLHKCDVKKCVNPDHLFVGTQQDNMSDMIRKGRGHGGDRELPLGVYRERCGSLRAEVMLGRRLVRLGAIKDAEKAGAVVAALRKEFHGIP
jgi:hypothetical protein